MLQLAQINLQTNLERCSLWCASFVEKAHRSFSLVKTNLTFRLLQQNLLQNWSTFFCISLECSPINSNLKYLILISDSVFWELFSFLQFILSFKYDLTAWSFIVIRNGKIVWKVVWIEYYLRLNLNSRRC